MEKELRELHDKLEFTRPLGETLGEEKIRTTREIGRLRNIIDQAHDAILVRAVDDTILLWNGGAEETYGFRIKEALDKNVHELLKTKFPEPLDQILERLRRKGRWEGELTHTTSSGKEIIVESRWSIRSRWAIHSVRNTEPRWVLEINRDITARKQAEEALRSKMARLELVNAELQNFTFVAAHHLQEPLRKIQTFCDMAMKRCASALDSAGQDYLNRVVNSASHMRNLIHDLSRFSRVAANPEPRTIDLNSVAREAADLFEGSIKRSDCRIKIENLPSIEADESLMSQLFENLIGNALKFRSDRTPHIKVHGESDGDGMCEIVVEDNGIGFDQQFAELIFKPFERLHGHDGYDGTGMGLAICRKIVERHGGTIGVESKPGVGTTFIIRLPAKQPKLERAAVG